MVLPHPMEYDGEAIVIMKKVRVKMNEYINERINGKNTNE